MSKSVDVKRRDMEEVSYVDIIFYNPYPKPPTEHVLPLKEAREVANELQYLTGGEG